MATTGQSDPLLLRLKLPLRLKQLKQRVLIKKLNSALDAVRRYFDTPVPAREDDGIPADQPVSDLFTFDRTGWLRQGLLEDSMVKWESEPGVYVIAKLSGQPTLPYDLSQPELFRTDVSESLTKAGQCLIDFDLIEVQGVQGYKCVFKYYATEAEDDLRKSYYGTLCFPLSTHKVLISTLSNEEGTSGVRESTVTMMLIAERELKLPTADAPPAKRVAEDGETLVKMLKKQPLQVAPSDAPDYDDTFPDHPLTRVRRTLAHIQATLSFDETLKAMGPYRVDTNTKS